MARICVEKLILQALQFRKLEGLPDPSKLQRLQNCRLCPWIPSCRALIRKSGPHRTVASLATRRLNSSCQLVARIWLSTEISAFETCMCFWSARSLRSLARKLLQIFCHRLYPAEFLSLRNWLCPIHPRIKSIC